MKLNLYSKLVAPTSVRQLTGVDHFNILRLPNAMHAFPAAARELIRQIAP